MEDFPSPLLSNLARLVASTCATCLAEEWGNDPQPLSQSDRLAGGARASLDILPITISIFVCIRASNRISQNFQSPYVRYDISV